jgi:hypothetical protein
MNQPDIRYDSPEWLKVRAWLQGEWLETVKRIASPHQTEKEADVLRGKASFIDYLLSLKTAVERPLDN